jgi:hypothetical protein
MIFNPATMPAGSSRCVYPMLPSHRPRRANWQATRSLARVQFEFARNSRGLKFQQIITIIKNNASNNNLNNKQIIK